MERLLEEISYESSDHSGKVVGIDAEYVNKRLNHLMKDDDLSRYIL